MTSSLSTALFNAIGSTGYQLVSGTSAVPKQQADPIMKAQWTTFEFVAIDDVHVIHDSEGVKAIAHDVSPLSSKVGCNVPSNLPNSCV